MAEINADANDVIAILGKRLADAHTEIAVLTARLYSADSQLDAAVKDPAESRVKKA